MSQQILSSQSLLNEPVVEFKGSSFTLTILLLSSFDVDAIVADIKERLAQAPKFFLYAPVVLDLNPLKDQLGELDFASLAVQLRNLQLVPVGVCNGKQAFYESAIASGFAVLQSGPQPRSLAEKVKSAKPAAPVAEEPAPSAGKSEALVIHKPVRSGQQIYARGRDLILMAPVNAGAEVIADGNIHVYAALRGRALAGVQGDTSARIFSLNFGAEMVSIAGNYRVFEDQPAANVAGKPSQVLLENEQLIVSPLI